MMFFDVLWFRSLLFGYLQNHEDTHWLNSEHISNICRMQPTSLIFWRPVHHCARQLSLILGILQISNKINFFPFWEKVVFMITTTMWYWFFCKSATRSNSILRIKVLMINNHNLANCHWYWILKLSLILIILQIKIKIRFWDLHSSWLVHPPQSRQGSSGMCAKVMMR